VKRNPGAAFEFYDDVLGDIDPSMSFYTAMVHEASYILGEKTAEDVYEEAINSEDDADIAHLIFSKNPETDLQAEVFAHDSNFELGAGFGGTSALRFMNFGKNIQNFNGVGQLLEESPEAAAIAGVSLPAGYLLARDAYDIATADALVESNLQQYDEKDRKRAMLYNSKVESDLDDYLAVLDGYGIE
jgi:hypothetical protein